MTVASNLGFPRVGANRELKRALEAYWSGEIAAKDLAASAAEIRRQNWGLQRELDSGHIPSNDFSLYDHVLDTVAMVGAVPERYGVRGGEVDPDTYFAMARGVRGAAGDDAPAMEMTKWFDTNYHYMVPEFDNSTRFRLSSLKPIEEFEEAKAAGVLTRPVLLGPLSFLLLGKSRAADLDPLALLDGLLPVYEELLHRLAGAGAQWVQVDEPCLILDLPLRVLERYAKAYDRLAAAAPKLLLATYFESLPEPNLKAASALPVAALHLDLVRGAGQLDRALELVPERMALSLGLVDGRNVWRTDLEKALGLLETAAARVSKERVMVAPSCSLIHVPYDLGRETELDPELKSWMAFARQKLDEVALLAKGLREGREAIAEPLADNRKAMDSRRTSSRIHDSTVKERLAAVAPDMLKRRSPFAERRRLQKRLVELPRFPTTTIGSFPQTREVRKTRAAFRRGELDRAGYEVFVKREIEKAIRWQEETGLDVLVHGEFERNDMVEYFGERLEGFAFTRHGWVQSYGSRCVKPPIIYGDVSRERPITVAWSAFAQSLTDRPVKGMLTGPITIMQWSFVRDDQPRETTCWQLALAIRDEVKDLEAAGIRIIQIDEPALREGLPLRKADWGRYLAWAVEAFRLASSGVKDETQMHSHMCYGQFNDIIEAIAELDADVIFIESSRSQMELLDAFVDFRYPNEIGPGVYDIHSPRVPDEAEIAGLVKKAAERLAPEQIWVNPDCGLKTRAWPETKRSVVNMVQAARRLRREFEAAEGAA